jgi:hypothetical protein
MNYKKNRIVFSFFNPIILFFLVTSCSSKFHITQLSPKLPTAVYGVNEPSIAIHPTNSNEISVGAVYNHFFSTQTAGKTWTEDTLHSTFGVRGDPVLLYDNMGILYYFHLANLTTNNSLDRIICQKKITFESKFDNGSFTNLDGKQHDKEAVYFDEKTKHFHLTWSQFDKYASNSNADSSHILYAFSSDKCKTWSIPKRIDDNAGLCLDDDNSLEGAISITDISGNLHVIWMGPTGITKKTFINSTKSWSSEKVIKSLENGWEINISGLQRSNGFAQVVCDKSNGKFNGRIYYCWVEDPQNSGQNDVWLMYSDDETKTWSTPLKIGKDTYQTDQFFSALALDQSNGKIYIVYNDLKNYPQKQSLQMFDVKLSTSKDGGKTFKEETIQTKRVVSKEVFFGDYNSIAVQNGTIALAYATIINDKCTVEVAIRSTKKIKH